MLFLCLVSIFILSLSSFGLADMVVATAAPCGFSQVMRISERPYSARSFSPRRFTVASSQASSLSRRLSLTASHTRGLYQCSARQTQRTTHHTWSSCL